MTTTTQQPNITNGQPPLDITRPFMDDNQPTFKEKARACAGSIALRALPWMSRHAPTDRSAGFAAGLDGARPRRATDARRRRESWRRA